MSDAVRVTLLDRDDVDLGYSKLDMMLGRRPPTTSGSVQRRRQGGVEPAGTVKGIDPGRRVATDIGSHDADFLVIAMARTTTWRPRPVCGRAATSTTRSRTSACATRSPASTAASPRPARPAVQVPARPVRGRVHAPRALRGAPDGQRGRDLVGLPDEAAGPGDGRRRADVPRRARLPRHHRAARAPRHRRRSVDADGAARRGGDAPVDLFVGSRKRRAPDPLEASSLTVDGWVPVDQTTSGRSSPASTRSATSAPAPGTSRRPGSSPSRPRSSSPTTSRRRSRAVSRRRRSADRGSATPSSAAGSSARSR